MKTNKNIAVSSLFVIFILAVSVTGGFCQANHRAFANRLLRDVSSATDDSIRIAKLSDLAFYYLDYAGDTKLADSTSEKAVQLAESSHRPELLFHAYSSYTESNDLHENFQKALDYARKAEQITFPGKTTGDEFRSYKNLSQVYISGYEFDDALKYGYKMLSIAGITDNNALKAESYIAIGQCLEGKNQKIEAFRNYLNAMSLSERTRNVKLQGECYARLSSFYNFSKLYEKATHYKLMQRDLILHSLPIDSVAFMWTEYDLQVIDINSNYNKLYEHNMQEILDFARRKNQTRLFNYEIALIRTHFIEANKIGLLHDLYYLKFPKELDRLSVENPALYFRLKALFCEESGVSDSALYYFNRAEKLMQSDPNIILRSNFYSRFGQFLMRNGMKDKAIEKYSTSFELAKSAFYIEYMLSAAKNLETIYAEKGDYRNAFNYSVMNKVLNDSMNNISKKDQLLIMEIDHETHQRELTAELEKQSVTRRHYLQYSGMTIGILTVFVILIMLGSFRVSEWIIRTLGFFSFIFLFEFIILLADQQIHEFTHGEPWKVLLIKIFLIAILLPLHHTIEKRLITFLLNHKLLDIANFSIVRRVKDHARRMNGTRQPAGRTGHDEE